MTTWQRPRRRAVQREKGEQQHIVDTIRMVGGEPWVLGTRRRRGANCPKCGEFVPEHQGTRQTPGFPDVVGFIPVPTFTPAGEQAGKLPVLVFVEVKAEGGRLTPDQRRFREWCLAAGAVHISGGFDAFIAWLLERRVCHEHQFPHYRLPKGGA